MQLAVRAQIRLFSAPGFNLLKLEKLPASNAHSDFCHYGKNNQQKRLLKSVADACAFALALAFVVCEDVEFKFRPIWRF